MRTNYWFIILCAISYSLTSCGQTNETISTIEHGEIEGLIYKNEQFNLKIGIPENWYFMNENQRAFVVKRNIGSIIKKDSESKKVVELISEKNALIFAIFKFSPDTIMEVNPNMTIAVTNISEYLDLQDLEYAVEQAIDGINEMSDLFEFEEERTEIIINNKIFRGYKFEVTAKEMTANYESFIGNYDNFNIQITVSFNDESEKKELFNILKNIRTLN